MKFADSIVEIVSAIVSTSGFCVAFIMYRFHVKHKRMEYLQKIHDEYLKNDELIRFFNRIEWDRSELTMMDLQENSIIAEKLFGHFNYICFLMERGYVDKHHLPIFRYMVGRLVSNDLIKAYLNQIDAFSKKCFLPNPYQSLYAQMNKST